MQTITESSFSVTKHHL